LFTELNAQPAPAIPASPPPHAEPHPHVDMQTTPEMEADLEALDRALAESAPVTPQAPSAAPAPEPVAAQAPAAPLARVDAATEIAAELDANEKKALAAAVATPEPVPEHKDETYALPPPEPKVGRDPILFRVLELANYPLLACSDAAREAVGKIALLTLFNSVAVLVYVILFRKHPHH
jgi:hypothetical protein